MNILISGAGIAGTTLAYWLAEYGHAPTLVERAPRFRAGGYVIDFWGAGFDVADRMRLSGEIKSRGYQVQQLRIVNREGRRVSGFPVSTFERLTCGRYASLPRGDLASLISSHLSGRVETLFGDSIASVEESPSAVRVRFSSGLERDFDLVVGADGLHSRVRELVFGPQSSYERFLGYRVAAFEAPGYQPRDELAYVLYTEVGQQVGRFALRGDNTMILFVFADPAPARPEDDDPVAQKALLRARFARSGWECPRILEALDRAPELYFDRASQIRMHPAEGLWSRGRVTLVGDAAFCVSFLAGQGSALAMTAAYILAGELHRARGDYAQAFARYQDLFGPFVAEKQRAALRFGGAFAPHSRFSLGVRNALVNLMRVAWVADLAMGSALVDKIALPDYSSA